VSIIVSGVKYNSREVAQTKEKLNPS